MTPQALPSSPQAPRALRSGALALLFALCAGLGAAGLAQSFANPGFEDGLSGWSSAGGVTTTAGGVYTSDAPNETIDPPDWTILPFTGVGTMAQLQPAGSVTVAMAQAALKLSAATVDYLVGVFPKIVNVAYVHRDVELAAGEEFTLAWNYVATDYDPYNDASFVSLVNLDAPAAMPYINGGRADITVLAATVTGGNYNTGDYGSSGWQTVSFKTVTAGTYRLGFAAFNLVDKMYSPYLFIDEATGVTLKDDAPFPPIPPSDNPPPPQVEPDAEVVTGAVTDLSSSGATAGGSLVDAGGTAVTAHGHVWSTATAPTVALATRTDLGAAAVGDFASTLSGLAPETTYYLRAYATNANGTAYGAQLTFATPAPEPILTSFSPASAGQGEVVTLSGSNLSGVTQVSFGGVPAFDFTVVSDAQVEATVAYGSSGEVAVVSAHGSAARPGFTYTPADTYTFDTLPLGMLDGVDGWSTEPLGSSSASFGFQVLVPGVTTPLNGGGQNSAVAGHDGSRAARFPHGGPNIVGRAARVDNDDWALGSVPAGAVTVVEFAMLRSYWDGTLTLGRDADGDGFLSAAETGIGLSLSGPSGTRLIRPGGATVAGGGAPGGTLKRYQIVLDRSADGASAVVGVTYLDLASPASGWQPVSGLLGIEVDFGASDPEDWNAFQLTADSWDPAFLFDDLVFRTVTPSARAVDLGAVNVGAASAGAVLAVAGERLTGGLRATVSGDFLVNDATAVDAVTDGSELTVTFHPSAGGARSGTLTLVGDDMALPLVIALQGAGVPPTITGFTPDGAATGTPVVLTGVNLTGATAVAFGGVAAYSFTVDSDSQITAVLAGGASGEIAVTTPHGTATFDGFEAAAAGSVYLEAVAGAGRFTVPADHPMLADGVVDADEYAGDISLDPAAGGSFAALEPGAALSVSAAADVVVATAVAAEGRGVLLRAGPGSEIRLLAGVAVTATGGDVTLVAGSWTNLAGPDALGAAGGRVRVYTASPLSDVGGGLELRERFGVSYPDDPVVSGHVHYYAASLIEGHAFVDADLNGVPGSAEVGIPGVPVGILDSGLDVVTDAQGRFRLIGLPAGAYRLWAGTPDGRLEGYVVVGEPERDVQLAARGVVQAVDFGFFPGARLAGYVFRDDGGADALANDGVLGAGEAGRPGVEVVAVHAAGVSAVRTGEDGGYELFVAAGPVTLAHAERLATGHSSAAGVVLADGGTPDLVGFEALAGETYGHDFGVVSAGSFGPAAQGQVAAPGSRSYALRYRPGTRGMVTFDVASLLAPGALHYRLALDGACVGQGGPVEVGTGAGVLVGSAWPRVAGELAACDLALQVVADPAAPAGLADTATVTAELAWAGQATRDTSSVGVRTEVAGTGQLRIAKAGRNLSSGGDFAERFAGVPGDELEYRVRYANIGKGDVFEVVIHAVAHGPAEVISGAGAGALTCPDGSVALLELSAPLLSVDLSEHCALALRPHPDGVSGLRPALLPGQEGDLRYRVRIR